MRTPEEILQMPIEMLDIPALVRDELDEMRVKKLGDLYSVGFVALSTLESNRKPYFPTLLEKLDKVGFDTDALLDGEGKFTSEEMALLKVPLYATEIDKEVMNTYRIYEIHNVLDLILANLTRIPCVYGKKEEFLESIGITPKGFNKNGKRYSYKDGMIDIKLNDKSRRIINNAKEREDPNNLSVREVFPVGITAKKLLYHDIRTIAELITYSRERLKLFRGFNESTLATIENALAEYGFTLEDDKNIKDIYDEAKQRLKLEGIAGLKRLKNEYFAKDSFEYKAIASAVEEAINEVFDSNNEAAKSTKEINKAKAIADEMILDFKQLVVEKRKEKTSTGAEEKQQNSQEEMKREAAAQTRAKTHRLAAFHHGTFEHEEGRKHFEEDEFLK